MGIVLWVAIGPIIILIGIVTPSTPDQKWSFFKAYPWLSGSPPLSEISSTYWIGLVFSVIGLCLLVGGIVGIILALSREFVGKRESCMHAARAEFLLFSDLH
jgi:hypothetical protein